MRTFNSFSSVARTLGCVCALTTAMPAGAQGGAGLSVPTPAAQQGASEWAPAAELWSPWKGRLGFEYSSAAFEGSKPALTFPGGAEGLKLRGVRVLGDYYFSPTSGFRATGGLMHGVTSGLWLPSGGQSSGLGVALRSQPWSPPDAQQRLGLNEAPSTSAYLGAGYSWAASQVWGGDWSFSADLGLMVARPGGLSLGSSSSGAAAVGDWLHDLRLRPVLQLGVSYSF